MKYSASESMQYIAEEDVKFIRLAFCDVYGKQKNISVMPEELARAFESGIAIDASAIPGFGGSIRSDLLLYPDPSTISVLPWRPEHGKVVRMYCSVKTPEGNTFEADTRSILKLAAEDAAKEGISFEFGTETEFYLFKRDENGEPTKIPYDNAGYMDIAPEDKGENVRREICLTLERMSIKPERSHHEEGPGQNEIDFRYSDALEAADNAITFRSVVRTIAARSGLFADFSPKPLEGHPGNGMHINISVKKAGGVDVLPQAIAGIMEHISDMTVFLNPSVDSYRRFGGFKAPTHISWGAENRSQLIRIPYAPADHRRAELRSPDPLCNPYLAFALLIRAGLDGIKRGLTPPPASNVNLNAASAEIISNYTSLPTDRTEAAKMAESSRFIADVLPASVINDYCENK